VRRQPPPAPNIYIQIPIHGKSYLTEVLVGVNLQLSFKNRIKKTIDPEKRKSLLKNAMGFKGSRR
jgi:hypothetical protein